MLFDLPKRLARRWFAREAVPERPPFVQTLAIGPHNMREALELPPREYEYLRIDVSTNCNLFCTYCEIGRGKAMLDPGQMREFLGRKVARVQNVYFGCGMEPTINRELGAYVLSARELVDPPGQLGIQTNGTLLHRHDFGRFRDADLNTLSLSIDSLRPDTMQHLRGTDVQKVLDNLGALQAAIPQLAIQFSVVVSKANYAELPELIDFAIERGVQEVWLRELTYQLPQVPPERAELLLEEGAFERLKPVLQDRAARIPLFFLDSRQLNETASSYLDSMEQERPTADQGRADSRLQPST
jgi:MoaA/NifB/PqqE/SkfB family radical SAM enzyme